MRKFLQIFISLSFILCVGGVLMAQTDLRISKTEKLNRDREALLKNRQSLQIIDIQQVDKASFANRESSQLKDKKAVNNISALSSPEVSAHHRFKSIPVADKVKLSDKKALPALAPPAEEGGLYSISAYDCNQITSLDISYALDGFEDFMFAEDIVINTETDYYLEGMTLLFLINPIDEVTGVGLHFFDNCGNNGPGVELDIPISGDVFFEVVQGDFFNGLDAVEMLIIFDEPLYFPGGVYETTYWAGIVFETLYGTSRALSSSDILGNSGFYLYDHDSEQWYHCLEIYPFTVEQEIQMDFYGQCEDIDFNNAPVNNDWQIYT